MFIFDAATVTFSNATTMTLSGLPNSTAYVQYPPRVSGGTFAKVRLLPAQGPTQGSAYEIWRLMPSIAWHISQLHCRMSAERLWNATQTVNSTYGSCFVSACGHICHWQT